MRIVRDTSWMRRGISLLWGRESFGTLIRDGRVSEVKSFVRMSDEWPATLPAAGGRAVAVVGLDACLDALSPADARTYLEEDLGPCVLSFQTHYEGQRGLVFWLPGGRDRIHMSVADETYEWRCPPPFSNERIAICTHLWGGAAADVRRILAPDAPENDLDGPGWHGLQQTWIS